MVHTAADIGLCPRDQVCGMEVSVSMSGQMVFPQNPCNSLFPPPWPCFRSTIAWVQSSCALRYPQHLSRRGWGENWSQSLQNWLVGCAQGEQHSILLNDSRAFGEQSRRIALWEINDLRDHLKELLVNMIITASEPICLSSRGSEKGVWKKMVRLWILILLIVEPRVINRLLVKNVLGSPG